MREEALHYENAAQDPDLPWPPNLSTDQYNNLATFENSEINL